MTTHADKAAKKNWLDAFGWADAPRLSIVDLAAMLWAERVAVVATGAVVCLVGFAIAMMAPRSYAAHAELLVRLGQEYVYQPNSGATGAGAGAAPDMQAVVNSELRMIGSEAVALRVINTIGLRTLYPEIAASGGPEPIRMAAATRAFAQHLSVETAPQTPTLTLTFKHPNPQVASRALNTLIDQYLDYRRDVLVGGESDALSHQSQDLDRRSAEANAALSTFLAANGVGDFESEMTALAARAADAETQSYDAAARRGEAEGRAAALRARANSEPAEIELYTESDARRALVDLQVQRNQLLSRYQDNAAPVREIDRRINQLNSFLETGDLSALTRRGANPVRQEVQQALYTAEAEARAQHGREAALATQRDEVRARLRVLQALEPQYRQLLRERTILEQNAGNFANRAEEARSFSQLLGRSTDNISEVERASPPAQGKSLRLPIALATLLLAAIAALAVGFARAFLRRSFPTPASAARTLDAPMLAVTPRVDPKRAPQAANPTEKTKAAAKPELKLVEIAS